MAIGKGYQLSWVKVNGVRTRYAWSGTQGPTVVMCHGGGPGSSGEAGWHQMLPALAEAGFRAYAPDQLSMGWTDVRPHAWPVLGHQSLVDHVAAFIETLCLEPVCLVGNSQGAYVAAKIALDHPERVDKIFLIGSGTISGSFGIQRPDEGKNQAVQALREYDFTQSGMRRFLEAIVNGPVSDTLVETRHQAASRPGVREAMAAFTAYRQRMNQETKLWQRFSVREKLPLLSIPARFIWGLADRFAPVEMGYQLAEFLPNIPFEFVPEAGHQCQNDRPDLVNAMVIDFFRGA